MNIYGPQRFVDAQRDLYPTVLRELRAGRKESHYMWFVFPQYRGLGTSPMAQRYAIGSIAEASAYLAHPLLGPRLIECTSLVNALAPTRIGDIFGYPDDLKFHSCMTLFNHVAPGEIAFKDALRHYFGGRLDGETQRLLRGDD